MHGVVIGVLGTLLVLLVLRLVLRVSRGRFCSRAHGRRWLGGRFFRRLGATAEQRKVFWEGLEELRRQTAVLRLGLFGSREELATALRSEHLESDVLEHLWAKQLERASAMKDALVAALGRFHAALDVRQRALLADLVLRAGARPSCH